MRSCCRQAQRRTTSRRCSRDSAARRAIGTSSVRRIAQLAALFPPRSSRRFAATSTPGCASWMPASTTRWCSQRPACAGSDSASASPAAIPLEECVPAPGQGIVARRDSRATIATAGARCERHARRRRPPRRSTPNGRSSTALGGGCQLPLGALAVIGATIGAPGDRLLARRRARRPGAGRAARRRAARRSANASPSSCRASGALERPRTPRGRADRGLTRLTDPRRRSADSRTADHGLADCRCTNRPSSTSSAPAPAIPSLLTRARAASASARADVVVYDHRVRERVLQLRRRTAERIDVGAAAPKPLDQDAISYLLAEKAREGKVVVRLKWGDPFVFDSGGKEAHLPARAAHPVRGRARRSAGDCRARLRRRAAHLSRKPATW